MLAIATWRKKKTMNQIKGHRNLAHKPKGNGKQVMATWLKSPKEAEQQVIATWLRSTKEAKNKKTQPGPKAQRKLKTKKFNNYFQWRTPAMTGTVTVTNPEAAKAPVMTAVAVTNFEIGQSWLAGRNDWQAGMTGQSRTGRLEISQSWLQSRDWTVTSCDWPVTNSGPALGYCDDCSIGHWFLIEFWLVFMWNLYWFVISSWLPCSPKSSDWPVMTGSQSWLAQSRRQLTAIMTAVVTGTHHWIFLQTIIKCCSNIYIPP